MQQTRHNRIRHKLRIIAKLCARKGGDAIDEKFRCRLQVADEEVRDGFVGFESVATVLVSAFFDDFGGLIQCGVCNEKRWSKDVRQCAACDHGWATSRIWGQQLVSSCVSLLVARPRLLITWARYQAKWISYCTTLSITEKWTLHTLTVKCSKDSIRQ